MLKISYAKGIQEARGEGTPAQPRWPGPTGEIESGVLALLLLGEFGGCRIGGGFTHSQLAQSYRVVTAFLLLQRQQIICLQHV